MKPELSKKNDFYLPKHRLYELRHFCRQYRHWKNMAKELYSIQIVIPDKEPVRRTNNISDPVTRAAILRERYLRNMELVDTSARDTDPVIGKWIFKGVTEGRSYDQLNAEQEVPCGKNQYYELYHKFFWILSERQNLGI